MTSGRDMHLPGEMALDRTELLEGSKEFMRMWAERDGVLICLIDPAALDADPFVFGMAIVDAIRHGSKAYARAVDISEAHALARITEGVEAELGHPTDLPVELPATARHN